MGLPVDAIVATQVKIDAMQLAGRTIAMSDALCLSADVNVVLIVERHHSLVPPLLYLWRGTIDILLNDDSLAESAKGHVASKMSDSLLVLAFESEEVRVVMARFEGRKIEVSTRNLT